MPLSKTNQTNKSENILLENGGRNLAGILLFSLFVGVVTAINTTYDLFKDSFKEKPASELLKKEDNTQRLEPKLTPTAPQIANSKTAKSEINPETARKYRGSMVDYLAALGQKESSTDYGILNEDTNAVGKYQFLPGAMEAVGLGKNLHTKIKDGETVTQNSFSISNPADWKNKFRWSEKANKLGIYSINDFRRNPKVQEYAMVKFMEIGWKEIKNNKLDSYMGKNIKTQRSKSLQITKSGTLAAWHLGGINSLRDLLTKGIDRHDGQKKHRWSKKREIGTYLSSYMTKFANYKITDRDLSGKNIIGNSGNNTYTTTENLQPSIEEKKKDEWANISESTTVKNTPQETNKRKPFEWSAQHIAKPTPNEWSR